MIVKDESHIIRQTLAHLLTVFPITYWVIDDTGSTDGTQEIIRQFFEERGISGELYETPWRDFGWNRTQAFAHAFNKTDYVLVWDADDSVVGTLTLPAPLTADAYKLTFGNSGGFRYGRQQLFNNRRRWRYVGVLHEYPAPAEGEPSAREETIRGDYWCESGRVGARNRDLNKYLRDAEVLERGLLEEPTNARYAFYCANSYKDAGRADKAIEFYKRVLTMNGWAEEKYLACVRIWDLSACEANLPYLIESHQHVPNRVEGIQRLVEYYCIKNQNHAALGFYRFISEFYETHYLAERDAISRHLFVTRATYDYDLPYFVIISAIRTGNKPLALRMFDIIFRCAHTDVTPFRSNSLFFNLQFVISELTPSLEFLQRLLAYREALSHRLETNSEQVIMDIIERHRSLLIEAVPPHLAIREKSAPRILCTITTCKRLDLFTQTMNSLLRCWKDIDRVSEFVCVDDNSSEEDRAAMRRAYPFMSFVLKGPEQKGHRQSMNMIWAHLERARPDYWIHLEDDWLFYRERNYVTDALEFLERHAEDKIDQVLFNRNYAELPTGWDINGGVPLEKGYLLHEKSSSVAGKNCAYWPHYSFRPSMIRVAPILALGNYDSPNTFFEMDYANRWFSAGHRSAFFDTITCMHIGKLTSDRTGKNAYTLNGETQFGGSNGSTRNKSWIVNLERRSDRRADVNAAAAAAGLSGYQFWTAVDGQALTVTPEIQWLFTGNDFGSRRGVIGCALSHYRLWQQLAADTDADIYTIYEDDITFAPDFLAYRERLVVEFCRSGADLLYLGRSVFGTHPTEGTPTMLPLDKATLAGGTFGYCITRQGAKKLLDYIRQNGICHGIDYIMKIQPAQTFKQMMVTPPIVLSEWVRTPSSTVDSDIQKSSGALQLADGGEWIFHQGLDHMGDDIKSIRNNSTIDTILKVSEKFRGTLAFNTLGFIKQYKTVRLTTTPWFRKRDGIFIRAKFNVKILTNWGSLSGSLCDFERFTRPGGVWGNLKFIDTTDDSKVDFWIIINKPPFGATIDPARTIIFQYEPWCGESWQKWGVKTWGEWARPNPTKFFSVYNGPTPACWHCSLSYSTFLTMSSSPAKKDICISHVASAKYLDPGQKYRIDFLRFLEEKGDIPLAIYGKENYHDFRSYIGPVPDEKKERAIEPYRYYFMCENNSEYNYITEKIWEPILCESLCFYWGPPNHAEILTEGSYVPLDMTNFEESYQRIKKAIAMDAWSAQINQIRAEKRRILDDLNIMSVIHRIINDIK